MKETHMKISFEGSSDISSVNRLFLSLSQSSKEVKFFSVLSSNKIGIDGDSYNGSQTKHFQDNFYRIIQSFTSDHGNEAMRSDENTNDYVVKDEQSLTEVSDYVVKDEQSLTEVSDYAIKTLCKNFIINIEKADKLLRDVKNGMSFSNLHFLSKTEYLVIAVSEFQIAKCIFDNMPKGITFTKFAYYDIDLDSGTFKRFTEEILPKFKLGGDIRAEHISIIYEPEAQGAVEENQDRIQVNTTVYDIVKRSILQDIYPVIIKSINAVRPTKDLGDQSIDKQIVVGPSVTMEEKIKNTLSEIYEQQTLKIRVGNKNIGISMDDTIASVINIIDPSIDITKHSDEAINNFLKSVECVLTAAINSAALNSIQQFTSSGHIKAIELTLLEKVWQVKKTLDIQELSNCIKNAACKLLRIEGADPDLIDEIRNQKQPSELAQNMYKFLSNHASAEEIIIEDSHNSTNTGVTKGLVWRKTIGYDNESNVQGTLLSIDYADLSYDVPHVGDIHEQDQ